MVVAGSVNFLMGGEEGDFVRMCFEFIDAHTVLRGRWRRNVGMKRKHVM